jgi:hypothetical protein
MWHLLDPGWTQTIAMEEESGMQELAFYEVPYTLSLVQERGSVTFVELQGL